MTLKLNTFLTLTFCVRLCLHTTCMWSLMKPVDELYVDVWISHISWTGWREKQRPQLFFWRLSGWVSAHSWARSLPHLLSDWILSASPAVSKYVFWCVMFRLHAVYTHYMWQNTLCRTEVIEMHHWHPWATCGRAVTIETCSCSSICVLRSKHEQEKKDEQIIYFLLFWNEVFVCSLC